MEPDTDLSCREGCDILHEKLNLAAAHTGRRYAFLPPGQFQPWLNNS